MAPPSCGKFRSFCSFVRGLICLPDALAPVANDDSANGFQQRGDTPFGYVAKSGDSTVTAQDASVVSLSTFNPATAEHSDLLSLRSLGEPISVDFPSDVTDDDDSFVSTEPASDADSEDDIEIILDLVNPPSRPVRRRPTIKSACMDANAIVVGVPYGVVPQHPLAIPSGAEIKRMTKKFYAVSYGFYVGIMVDPNHYKTSIERVSGARHFSSGELPSVVAWFNAQLDCNLVAIV
ncbi:hypothetical protein EV715DRAFT_297762 [Schizophyllum commune]